jgi:hypothetical protein
MLLNKLIRPSTSPYAQNILIVKKEGKEPRVCIDPRPINKVTRSDPYPMTRTDEIFASLHGSVVFSTLDAASGFFQVPIAEEHRYLAAFRCEQGIFEFTCMPFGLRNAPSTFTRWMQITFDNLQHYLKIYMDDLLIHSTTITDHPKQLREVFERCRQNEVKLRLTKCDFFRTELKLLGFVITTDGVKKDLDKVQAIRLWGEKRPPSQFSPFKNLTELQSFMGLVNYYKHFHRFIADDLVILNRLMQKEANPKKDWTAEHEIAFQHIKETIATQTLLYYPDETRPFEIHTDASKYAIGGALCQVHPYEEEKITHPVEHYSRSLKGPELNYIIGEKEFLAVVTAIEKWKHYLWRPFKVITDHKPLLGIQHTEKPRLKRWMLRLTPFSFEVEHRPGRDMTDVDPLSRDPRLFRMAMEDEPESDFAPNVVYSSATVEIHATDAALSHLRLVRIERAPDPEQSTPSSDSSVHEDRQHLILKADAEPLLSSGSHEEAEVEVEVIEPIHPSLTLRNLDGSETTVTLNSHVEPKAEEILRIDQPIGPQIEDPSPEKQPLELGEEKHELESPPEEKGEEKITEPPEKDPWDIPHPNLEDIFPQGIDPNLLHAGTKTFSDEQRQDETLREIIELVQKFPDSTDYFIEKSSKLLLKRSKNGCPRVVVPKQAINTLMYLFHDHPLAGHSKPQKMEEAIKTRFYFPLMKEKITQWVRNCKCMRATATLHRKAGYTLSRPIPALFAFLVIDVVGPFPTSRRQNKYWLTLLDAFSKDCELVPIKANDAIHVAKAILVHWICRRGCPKVLLSDNAQNFVGHVVSHLCDALQIRHDLITAYHHEGTGLIEKVHAFAESMLRTATEKKHSLWDEQLPYIQFAIATHTVDDSGVSPFQIKHGIPATLPGDLLLDSISVPKDLRAHYDMAQKAMVATREYFKIQRTKKRIHTQIARNQRERRFQVHFKVGDYVYVTKPSFLKISGVVGLNKTVGKHRGPYRIVKVDPHNTIWVDVDGVETDFNVSFASPAPTPLPLDRRPPDYADDSLEYSPKENRIQTRSQIREEQGPNPAPEKQSKISKSLEQKINQTAQKETDPSKPTTSKGKKTRQFTIVLDKSMGQHYAGEILQDGTVHLYKKAKKGQYHPTWYSPKDLQDPPKSKSTPSRPKGYEKWVINPQDDDTWSLIPPTVAKMSQLKHNLIT